MKITVASLSTIVSLICIIQEVSCTRDENETVSAVLRVLAISEWRFSVSYAVDPLYNLTLFFCELFNTAQQHFNGLSQYSLDLKIELEEVLVNKNESDQPYIENNFYNVGEEYKSVLSVRDVLTDLREYMQQQDNWASQYDLVILFVQRSLLPEDVSSEIFDLEYAPEAGFCTGLPSVDIMITYPNIVAQDIAYFIASGSELRDFTEKERRDCSQELSSIYYAKLTNRRFGFSECLAKKMKSSLKHPRNDCLKREYDSEYCKPYIT